MLLVLQISRLTFVAVTMGSWLERFMGSARVQYWTILWMLSVEEATKMSRKDSDRPL